MSHPIHAHRQPWFKSAFTAGSGIMNFKPSVLGVAALATAAAALLAPNQVFAVEYYLRAEAVSFTVPTGGTSIPMWGYALCTASWASCDAATVPGPALAVPVGDPELTVKLANNLPAPTSLVINGLIKPMTPVWNDGTFGPRGGDLTKRVRSFDTEAPAGGEATYTWNNPAPGTYLYQSGTHPQVQVQMGLYGAVTKDASATEAYPGVVYNNQATLLYSEIDPALHTAVGGTTPTYGTAAGPTSTFDYQPKYFLINGKVYPNDPIVELTGGPGVTLLRFLNAGLTTHVPMIDGTYWTLVAEDGKPYPWQTRQYTALLPAAKTMDVLLTPDAGGAVYAVLDRRLSLSNNGLEDGGMLAFLQYAASGTSGGGLSGSVSNQPPVAVGDAYTSVQGVTLNVAAAQGVLANDNNTDGLPQPMRAVAVAVTVTTGHTSEGGTYTLNTNGSFTYTPLAGFTGNDTFTYQVTDGLATASASVTINLSTPAAPTSNALDNFDRGTVNNLGANWSQVVSSVAAEPNLQVVTDQAKAMSVGLGGLAIWNTQFLATQSAGFESVTPLNGSSALVLKATGGTTSAPANYVRVRCEDNEVVVATMMGGSNVSIYVTQATFGAAGCATSGTLSATVDNKGIVTTFVNSAYVGGVQLPNVTAWQGPGNIGLQMQSQDAIVDNFSGGS
ncbi:Ig-like domain-containing protein [Hydrogenophaga sp. PAMC20947]|uniref:Ig-like domain-containing protein n=1 Tax=Hydrogenophaga sp. PAMC20947 TaxID=2565558 RepID=UPI00109DB441|nr:Ig-like domain-containing protein [Hydrogenophaga sp. PAMC20947]QCB45693.1 hypothetical protein E5678_06455 [Hydrogenophaga sp. PAMC20947]